mgnify:CR=1 FL=1
MHILICDDDAVFAARVETLVRDFFALRGLQVECTVCHSGEETLARRDLDLYQVALLDVDLDTMNGISLGRQLRERSPEICLIYISAYLEFAPEGYTEYTYSAEKKGYSGTAIFTRKEPLSVHYGIGIPQHDTEGRVITLEFPDFYMVTCYTPNSQNELARLSYRMEWEDAFLSYLKGLDRNKPLILCGDLNVAHEEIDLKNPKTNRKNAGFTDEERTKMTALLSAGFTDTFRHFYPDTEGIYSWWSYRFHAREKNAGWRIDYFITSSALDDRLVDAGILTDVTGSDHCPVTLTVDLPFCP